MLFFLKSKHIFEISKKRQIFLIYHFDLFKEKNFISKEGQ